MVPMSVAELLSDVLGDDVPVAFVAYDGSTFGAADARTTIVVRSPDALRRIVTAPDELGFGRAYVAGRARGRRRHLRRARGRQLHRGAAARTASDRGRGQARRLEGPEAAPSSARGSPPPRSAPLPRSRRRRHRVPLRRVERLLPDGARSVAHLLVRGLARRHHHARGRAGEQARARLPQARPPTRDAAPRRRVRVGRHAAPRGRAPRRAGGGRDALRTPGRAGAQARRRARAGRPGRGAPRRLPRRRRRSVRRDQLDRHVRARRTHRARPATSRGVTRCCAPRVGC